MLLGGRWKFKGSLSGRLGDVLSHLYAASHVLARYLKRGAPSEEEPLLSYAILDFTYRMEVALSSALRNFPYRPVGCLLWALVFPWGRRATPPGDGLSRRVASVLLSLGQPAIGLQRGSTWIQGRFIRQGASLRTCRMLSLPSRLSARC